MRRRDGGEGGEGRRHAHTLFASLGNCHVVPRLGVREGREECCGMWKEDASSLNNAYVNFTSVIILKAKKFMSAPTHTKKVSPLNGERRFVQLGIYFQLSLENQFWSSFCSGTRISATSSPMYTSEEIRIWFPFSLFFDSSCFHVYFSVGKFRRWEIREDFHREVAFKKLKIR